MCKFEEWSDVDLRERLSNLLVNNEKCKRTAEIEKIQLEIICRCVDKLSEKYFGKVAFAFDEWNTSLKQNRLFINYDGEIGLATEGYNEWYDCKRFDAILKTIINKKEYNLYFILKGVQNQGGHQRNVKQEVGGYCKAVMKNGSDKNHFFFVLDGDYINKNVDQLGTSNKFDLTTSDTIEKAIEDFITKHLD